MSWRGAQEQMRDAVLRWHVRGMAEAGDRGTSDVRMTRGEALVLSWYLLALALSWALLPHLAADAARIAVALLPLPPVALLVMLSVRRVLGMDELQQRIELTALAATAAGTWLGLLTCWMLQHAGVALPPLSLAVMGMVVLYTGARRWASRRFA